MWDGHFKLMFNIYKERYYKTIEALERHLPQNVQFHKPGGGLNIWLELPANCFTGSLLKAASAENIVFAPGRIFYSSTPNQSQQYKVKLCRS